uniref:Peptidase M28 domain-containing protein n=1 Tax=Megaselia scalaris TaxID=36166 RepID=T1GBU4_MEGSC
MAYAINGYRYHTKFDHIDYISRDSIQHTGNNVLELVKNLAHSLDLPNATEMTDKSMVFFDVFGFFFVSYSEDFATIFNYAVVIASIILPYLLLSRATRGINKKHLRFELFLGFLINMISLVGANAICYAIAYDLDHYGKSMSWY